MAVVAFPTGVARITELSLQRMNPGDVRHEVPSTGRETLLKFGYGLWHGLVTFGEMDDVAQAQRIEAFFASLDGGANTVHLPIDHIKASASDAPKTLAEMTDDDIGTYWNYEGRLYAVTGIGAGTASLWPTKPVPAGAALAPATHIVAKERDGAPAMPHTPHFLGPWTWLFKEAV